MDDINSKISEILSNPESMQQIQNMMAGLGLGQNGQSQSPQPPITPPPANNSGGGIDLSALNSILGSMGGGGASIPSPAASQVTPPVVPPVAPPQGDVPNMTEMMGAMTKLAPLMSQMRQEDDTTRLLQALKPLLGHEKRKKIDESIKMLQMMKMLPLLKSSGIAGSLFGL